MTENIREQMIASLERHFDFPAFLAARGFSASTAEPDPRHVEMVQRATGETLLLKKDIETGAWRYQNARHPEDHGSASRYFEAHDRLPRDRSLDRLIALATERNVSPEAIAYRRARVEKGPDLREMEQRHVMALHQEKAARRLLEAYGVDLNQLEGGRFGDFRKPSDLDRLVNEPEGLRASAVRSTDKVLVLTERPLDAIAYEQSKGQGRACYLFTGSRPSPETLHKVAKIVTRASSGMTVVLAFGRDEYGRALAECVRAFCSGGQTERDAPALGARWADQMQLERRHVRSLQRYPGQGGWRARGK